MFRKARLENCRQDNIIWDFDLHKEFIGHRQTGTGFVIDVLDGVPRLALYRMKMNYSASATLAEQPPRELLLEAVRQQDGDTAKENLYQINSALKCWIEGRLSKNKGLIQ